MFEKFLNLIYPNICGVCNKLNKESLCKKCELQFKKYEISKIEDFTKDKTNKFDYRICVFKYENTIRNMIIQYKFNEKAYLYKTFSKIIINNTKIYSFLKFYDIIIPIPMHKNKKAVRGYNQTELIAKEISKALNIKFEYNILIKKVETKTQSTLTKFQRINNVMGAFEILNSNKVKNKKIILFDDIYTTGSTVNECSKILKKAGAKKVLVLTLAKD